jgi:hypothetical protein
MYVQTAQFEHSFGNMPPYGPSINCALSLRVSIMQCHACGSPALISPPGKRTLPCHFLSIAHIVTAFSLHALSQPFHCMPFHCLIINAKLLPIHSMLGYWLPYRCISCHRLDIASMVTDLSLHAFSLLYPYRPVIA